MKKQITLALFLVLLATGAQATTYYVKSGGSDSNNCTSDATACATFYGVVVKSPAAGSDVYYKAGYTYTLSASNQRPVVIWSGSSSNPVVVGAYYMNGGSETPGLGGSARPIIDAQSSSSIVGTWGAVVEAQTTGTSYIYVSDLEVRNSAWRGIAIKWAANSKVSNCVVHDTQEAGIVIDTDANNSIVEDTEVYYHNKRYWKGYRPPGETWSCGIIAARNTGVTIRRCKVHEGSGEGINIYCSSYAVIEYCVSYNNRAVQLYSDWSHHVTIRYNIAYGTRNSDYYRSAYAVGSAIVIANEPWPSSLITGDITVYGNMTADTDAGIIIVDYSADGNDYSVRRVTIYNNTIIEPVVSPAIDISSGYSIITPSSDRPIIRNNIFVKSSGTIVNAPSGLTFSNNLWSRLQADVDSDARGTDSIFGQSPLLVKTSGWSSLAVGELNGAEFALQTGSPAINLGADLGTYSFLGSTVAFDAGVYTVYAADTYTPWDAGAVLYGAGATIPDVPSTVAAGTPTKSSIPLTWDAETGATYYEIHRCATVDGTYVFAKTVTTNSGTVYGLADNTAVYFKVLSGNTAGKSALSAEAHATTEAFSEGNLLDENCDSASDWTQTGTEPFSDATGDFVFGPDNSATDYVALTRTSPPTIPDEYSIQIAANMNDLTAFVSQDGGEGPAQLQGVSMGDGRASFRLYFTTNGIVVLRPGWIHYTVPGTADYVTTGAHTWDILVRYSEGTYPVVLDIYKDSSLVVANVECGLFSTWNAVMLHNSGGAVDTAEMTVTAFKLSSGLKPPIPAALPTVQGLTTTAATGTVFHYGIDAEMNIPLTITASEQFTTRTAAGAMCAMKLNVNTALGYCVVSAYQSDVVAASCLIGPTDRIHVFAVASLEALDAGCGIYDMDGHLATDLTINANLTGKTLSVVPCAPQGYGQ